ncbi:MAG TPA: hypothetical protein DCL54_11175 [Alphaproteobacteria bacterium]|nr:hypothetical protein [Alphaproteobacteria bacterium]HAJ47128.1 hypothetical protein [Alphaproteobacteria bacterium]
MLDVTAAEKQIEITPKMIEAGVREYGGLDPRWDPLPEMLARVFKAKATGLVATDSKGLKHEN